MTPRSPARAQAQACGSHRCRSSQEHVLVTWGPGPSSLQTCESCAGAGQGLWDTHGTRKVLRGQRGPAGGFPRMGSSPQPRMLGRACRKTPPSGNGDGNLEAHCTLSTRGVGSGPRVTQLGVPPHHTLPSASRGLRFPDCSTGTTRSAAQSVVQVPREAGGQEVSPGLAATTARSLHGLLVSTSPSCYIGGSTYPPPGPSRRDGPEAAQPRLDGWTPSLSLLTVAWAEQTPAAW